MDKPIGSTTDEQVSSKAKGVRGIEGNGTLVSEIIRICALEVDMVNVYQNALVTLQDKDFKATVTLFGAEHERHVANLTSVVLGLGGQPPLLDEALNEFRTVGIATLTGLDSDAAVLKAVLANEVLTNQMYNAFLESDLLGDADEQLRLMLEKQRADEQRHLEYIQDVVLILDRGGKVSISEQAKKGADFIDLAQDQDTRTQH